MAIQAQALLAHSPLLWAENTPLCVVHPTKGRIRFEGYQYQKALLADRSPARLVCKSRQVGITAVLALETCHIALHQPGATILWLSKDREAASLALGYAKTALRGLDAKLERDAETFIRLENGSKVISLPASPATARGFAATAVYLDEFAHVHYAQEVYQSVEPTVAQGGRITAISTPAGKANLFFLLWSGQQGGEWSRQTIYWYDCPAYNPDGYRLLAVAERQTVGERGEWYRQMRPKFTAQSWAQEFCCDFAGSGAARFRPGDVERAHQGASGPQPPQEGKAYITAWDIGRRQDATVGVTITGEAPYQVVAFDRYEGLPYPEIQRRIEGRAGRYPGYNFVESNGPGDPVIENLAVRVTPFVTTAKSKAQILDSLALALEGGNLKWRDWPQLDTEVLLYQDEDSDLVQDCVMALAIAVHGTRRLITGKVFF
jgi:hypothetical protein